MIKQHFTVVALTNEQLARGELSAISDAISNRFTESAQHAIANRDIPHKQVWATILFDNPLDYETPKKYDYDEVLYLNDTAKMLVEQTGIKTQRIDEIDEAPKNLGVLINMPIYLVP